MAVTVDLVVPIKELRRAKSRLVGATIDVAPTPAGRSATRAGLALALASDTLAAVLASSVRRVAVVTADPQAAALVRPVNHGAGPDGNGPDDGGEPEDGEGDRGGGAPRAVVVDDPGAGLNAAVRAGVEHLRGLSDAAAEPPGAPTLVAALLGDLPALLPAELDEAVERAAAVIAEGAPAAFVADHTEEGTTLLVLAPAGQGGSPFGPHFGPQSARAHLAAGAVALTGAWPGLRHDVDVPADLAEVRALGVGPATRAWPDVPIPAVPLAGCR